MSRNTKSQQAVRQHSMGLNALLSSIRTLSTIIFPLITYPYITGTLSVSNVGRVNFSQSIIGYFTLIAQFGILQFAVRSGARIRDDQVVFEQFANRVFTINIISTIISLILLFLLMLLPTPLVAYRTFIAILSVGVVLTPFSVDWIYTVYEDFGYITLRSILISLLSMILMFIFVKKNSDAYLYVALVTVSGSFGSLFNFFHSRKYVHLGLTKDTHWKEYKKPLFMFFINSVTTTIYLNSDTTLLGLMSTNHQVGLYSVATKIYNIAKQLINAVVATTIPRLAYMQKQDKKKFQELLQNIMNMTEFFVVPLMTGLIMVRKNIVLILLNSRYFEATESLAILSFALIFAVFANIIANGLLVVINKEKYVVTGTVASAVTNLLLNFIFIPLWGQNGAAATTLIAEMVMFGVSILAAKDYLKYLFDIPKLLRAIIGSVAMYTITTLLSRYFFSNNMLDLIETVVVGAMIYFISMILMRDETLTQILVVIKNKVDH